MKKINRHIQTIIFLIITIIAFPVVTAANRNDRVTFVASSTQYDETKLQSIKQALESKGYIVNNKYLNQVISDFGYVNTEKARTNILINSLLDKNTDIVWFVRGGGGAFNLMPYLEANKKKLKQVKSKIIVGFSDVTAIHYFVNNVLGWPSVHGIVANYNEEMHIPDSDKITLNDLEPIPSIKKLFSCGVDYRNLIPLNKLAHSSVHGILSGGNFSLIQAFFSTKYEQNFSNKILILEDTGISFRALDRSLHQLLYKKDLNATAIIFGQFYPLDPTDEQRLMYKTVIEKFAEKIKKPVYYYPFFGHGRKNKPLILGQEASIYCPIRGDYCTLKQPPCLKSKRVPSMCQDETKSLPTYIRDKS